MTLEEPKEEAAMDPQRQRMENLDKANEVRTERSQIKRQLAAGRRHPGAFLMNPPEVALGMAIGDVLAAAPNIAATKTARMMSKLHMSESTPLRDLSPARRTAIIAYVRENYPRTWEGWERRRPSRMARRHVGARTRVAA